MMLNPLGDLAAVELAFFSLTFLASILVCFRHGFARSSGYFYLLILSILRIVGTSCLIYAEVNNDYNQSLITAYLVTNNIGIAPMLLATLQFAMHIDENMKSPIVDQSVWHLLHIITLVILILAIVGGAMQGSSSAHSQQTGHSITEAVSILYVVVWAALSGIMLLILSALQSVHTGQRKLVFGILLALPFILVNIILALCSAWSNPGAFFYYRNPNVYTTAFMEFLPEAVVVLIYLSTGLMTQALPTHVGEDQAAQQYTRRRRILGRGRYADNQQAMNTV